MTRNGLIATCFVCLLIGGVGRAHGLDPSKRPTQYRHNLWRVQDGFFPGSLDWVSQTADGYLWVVTWSGVLRFDGVRYVPWSPPASASESHKLAARQSLGFKLGWSDKNQFVLDKRLRLHAASAGWTFDQSERHLVFEQKPNNLVRVAAVQRDRHAGILFEEDPE